MRDHGLQIHPFACAGLTVHARHETISPRSVVRGPWRELVQVMQRIVVIAMFAMSMMVQAIGTTYAHGAGAQPQRQMSHDEMHREQIPHSHQHDGKIKLDKSIQGALHVMQDSCIGATMLVEAAQLCEPSQYALRLTMEPGRNKRPPDPGRLIRPPRANA